MMIYGMLRAGGLSSGINYSLARKLINRGIDWQCYRKAVDKIDVMYGDIVL